MNHHLRACVFVAAAVIASAGSVASMAVQSSGGETLASVNIPRSVLANGQPLASGTYTLRLTTELAPPVAGQTPEASPWIQFVQGDQVKGRELAIVVLAADAKAVLKGPGPPPGSARVDLLEGNEYLRIWVTRGDKNYLLHLPVK